MILFSKVNKTPLESRSPIWLLGLKLLGDEDVSQSVLAANTLLYELENNSKRLIIANEIQIIITCLKTRVKKFEQSYKEVTRYTKLVKSEKREFIDKKRQFNEILFEITHMGKIFIFLFFFSFLSFYFLFFEFLFINILIYFNILSYRT